MNKIAMGVVLLLLLGIVLPEGAYAATVTAPVIVSKAIVSNTMSLTVAMKKNDWNGADITSMDFGTLMPFTPSGTLRSSTTGSTGTGAVLVWIWGHAQGAPYIIKQSGTALTSGTNKIPEGACSLVPVYISDDNSGRSLSPGAQVGAKGSWVATDKMLYTSESGVAKGVGIRAYYSITDDSVTGAATGAVPIDQPAGTYQGTVTITMTA